VFRVASHPCKSLVASLVTSLALINHAIGAWPDSTVVIGWYRGSGGLWRGKLSHSTDPERSTKALE
jgi:hypothetical protein